MILLLDSILDDISKSLWIRNRLKSTKTKGGYLVVNVPYELSESYEIEEMVQMSLEEITEKYDVYLDYELFLDKVKIYILD